MKWFSPILALVVICLGVWLQANSPSRTLGDESPGAPLEIIDVHTHASFTGEHDEAATGIPETLDEYLKEFKEAGVVGAVSMAPSGPHQYQDLSAYNVIQCYGVGNQIDLGQIEEGLSSAKYGCIKIYLGYIYRYAYDVAYRPVYELARKYRVPVVFHTGDTNSTRGKLKYADPLTIDEVAVDFQDVTFVIAHLGNPWIQSAAEVTYKNPNVYVEASALLIGNLAQKPIGTIEELGVKPIRWAFQYIENPQKMMFGTDWPLVRIPDYVELYKRAIPKEYWRAVFHDNAVKVFGFKR